MLFQVLFLALTAVTGILADCSGSIVIEGVSTTYGNDIVNGEYQLAPVGECNNRDIFRKGAEEMYLYHINNGIRGYWIVRNFYLCVDNSEDQGYVRANDLELNPGLIQAGWEEKISDENWDRDFEIDVDCFQLNAEKAKAPEVKKTNEPIAAKDAVKGRADVMNVSMGASKASVTQGILLIMTALWCVYM